MNGKVLVAGIGNIFLGDDAFGVEVVQQLSRRSLPDHVKVVDFGIRSYDLAYALMEEWEMVILVDALPRRGTPGTIYVMEPDLPEDQGSAILDAHSMSPSSVLRLVQALGGHFGRILVVGCEPGRVVADENGDFGLSGPVRHAVGEAVRVIEELIVRSARPAAA